MKDMHELIDSGKLELYVLGHLPSAEMNRIAKMSEKHPEVLEEIISIEEALANLSAGFAPSISAARYESMQKKLRLSKTNSGPARMLAYIGWTMTLLLAGAAVYLFLELQQSKMDTANAEVKNNRLRDSIVTLDTRITKTTSLLGIARDVNNQIVSLGGQKIAPDAAARVYWNRANNAVFVDGLNLTVPPEGKVYCVWTFQYRPLRATLVGAIPSFGEQAEKLFSVGTATDAEAFGITHENRGEVEEPDYSQLIVIGRT